ncbi:RD3 domain-containing protein [Trichomycterus rosablanca]|uniref:RD3 domain-containing protein n=1 Tax=Trichomycterus rosablanca TaxID=2290929 RepID=UPI002F353211
MFPWSAVFSLEPKVPGQRTSEELVTNTLMLELGAMVKRTERICLERASKVRRRSSSSSADYSWLVGPQPRVHYELTPGDVLDLQELCAKIPTQQCGPVIVRFRKLVTEIEPEVQEVPQLFRSVLRACLDEEQADMQLQSEAAHWEKRRSKSLSFVTFRSKFRVLARGRDSFGGSRGNLQEACEWSEEEEEEEEAATSAAPHPRRGRSKSMPEIIPIET